MNKQLTKVYVVSFLCMSLGDCETTVYASKEDAILECKSLIKEAKELGTTQVYVDEDLEFYYEGRYGECYRITMAEEVIL